LLAAADLVNEMGRGEALFRHWSQGPGGNRVLRWPLVR
jgi:hypothetical protein